MVATNNKEHGDTAKILWDWPQGVLSSGVSNSDVSFDKKARKVLKQSGRCAHISVTAATHLPTSLVTHQTFSILDRSRVS